MAETEKQLATLKADLEALKKSKVGDEMIADGKYSDTLDHVGVSKKLWKKIINMFSMVIMISNDHSLAAWFQELELRGKFQILK